MRKLKVGIIGLGVGEKHVAAYEAHPNCHVAAVCDLSTAKLEAYEKRYRTTTNAESLLTDGEIDLVSIASYDNFHYHQVMAALRHGKHVFIEKPLCLQREEALEIRSFLREKPDLKLSSNMVLRTSPRFRWLKNELEQGSLGDPYYVEADYLWGRLEKLTNGWRGEMPYYSIILGAGVHMIDLLTWLRPNDPIVRVQAKGNAKATAGSGFRFNDFAVMLLEFRSGLLAKVTGNAGAVHPHFHRLEVYGTKATFFNEPEGGKVFRSSEKDAKPTLVKEAHPGSEKHLVNHSFVDSILQSEKAPLVSADDVFRTMAICFAAEQSMQSSQPVDVTALEQDPLTV